MDLQNCQPRDASSSLFSNMGKYLLLVAMTAQSFAVPAAGWPTLQKRQGLTPQMATATVIGNVTDPNLDRDSCGSSRIGSRALWTCRDTMIFKNGTSQLPLIANTAGWTDVAKTGPVIKTAGAPAGAGSVGNPIVQMYGNPNWNTSSFMPYFPYTSSECAPYGNCNDGSRWVIWPDSPPLITQTNSAGSSAVGYTWIPKVNLYGFLQTHTPTPAYSLYRSTYQSTSNKNTLPSVKLVAEEFWKTGEIGFGEYGGVVSGGIAYMYGLTNPDKLTVLAKVPVGSIENRAKYQYYNATSAKWQSTPPPLNDTTCAIPNASAGGQGTYYYSTYYKSYIWIGQAALEPVANFYITTAPNPWGPWIPPYLLYQGENGDGPLVGAYSLQANPALLPSTNAAENAIYLSYTKSMAVGPYLTPLIYLTFK